MSVSHINQATAFPDEGKVLTLALDHVEPDPHQPRTEFDAEALAALAADIGGRGVENPIIVRRSDTPGRYIIKHGERRWRASRLAGRDTIPALVDATDAAPLDLLIQQVADNVNRDDLTPMDEARFLARLRDDHGIPVGLIPDTLAGAGITKRYSRPVVSNLLRLLRLPEWATDMIHAGTLTASHGKHIAPAVDSPAVLERLERLVTDTANAGHPITTAQLQDMVASAYAYQHPNVQAAPWRADHCDSCDDARPITDAHGARPLYCLDRQCHDRLREANRLQAAAEVSRETTAPSPPAAEEPAPPPPGREVHMHVLLNRWHTRFDVATCEGCEHRAPGGLPERPEPACYNLDCYQAKNDAAAGALSFAERVHEHLDKHLRRLVDESIGPDDPINMLLVSWMALSCPDGLDDNGQPRHADTARGWYLNHIIRNTDHLQSLPAMLAGEWDGHLEQTIAMGAIMQMDRPNLRRLARHLGITLDGYRIDMNFAQLLDTDARMADFAADHGIHNHPEWRPDDSLAAKQWALVRDDRPFREAIGIPKPLAEAYAWNPDDEETP